MGNAFTDETVNSKPTPRTLSGKHISGKLIPDKNRIMETLREVLDPEIGVNIVDLNMVRDISMKNGDVQVTIALTVAHCPLAKTLQADVERVLKGVAGVTSVRVETTSMSKKELEELRVKLQARTPSNSPSPEGPSVGRGIERLGKRRVRNIIAIVSGKGGVGKSFVTSFLASELKREGYEVGVLDADLTGPSIAKVFGVNERPTKGPSGIIPVSTRTGIKVMSINLLLDDPGTPVIWRGPIVNSVIRQLYWDVDWGDLHYLLVDLPPGTSDAPLTVFQSLPLDGVIVVSSPQHLSSMIVTKAVNMAKKMDAPLLGLVENMAYLNCPHCGERVDVFGLPNGEKLAATLGMSFLGAIPLDPEIATLSDQGRVEDYRSAVLDSITNKLRSIAAKRIEQLGLPIAWTLTTEQR